MSLAIVEELRQQCHAGDLECREHDDDARLEHLKDPVDSRVHGAWVYLQKGNDVWVIYHHPWA